MNATITGALPRIRGGIELRRHKPGLDKPIIEVPVPDTLVYPLIGHRGARVGTHVAPGDHVNAGTLLADGIVAAADGQVDSLSLHSCAHPSGESVPSLVIKTSPAVRHPESSPARSLSLDVLRTAGITGHGGAGYSAANKLEQVAGQCRCLLINAAECEPGIACDEALIQHDVAGIVHGIQALSNWLQPDQLIIAIESDKLAAIETLQAALADVPGARLLEIQPIYPSGAERPLVNLLLCEHRLPGLNVDEHPTDRGIVCLNVATVHAIGKAAGGHPVTHRIVSISGQNSCHARVAFGTPIKSVLEFTENTASDEQRIRIGGALSGYDIVDDSTPVSTVVNAISVSTPSTRAKEYACIRCGDCAPVCPSGLYPHLLHEHALSDNNAGLNQLGIERCIACGCCDLVCPSHIALTAEFRRTQTRLHSEQQADHEAQSAEELYVRRRVRVERDAQRKHVAQSAPASGDVAAALARARKNRGAPS